MAEKISVLIPREKVEERIQEMAAQINKDYEGKQLHLITILKGGVFFACELAKHITVPVSLDFMQVSSYGDGTKSSGIVRIKKDLDETLEGKEVLIVEDIIDSGITLHYLMPVLEQRQPASLKLCALLSKPDRRQKEVDISYLGFNIPDEFVIGYGLDYAQKYRNLPYIGVVELDEE
ncbi:MAG: hypoxanthine phosphoribosyltransferase [Eubacteriales bacterium]|nr:hypoxanthine phosphoribosyltransferase [Eubacteriales bacterium]